MKRPHKMSLTDNMLWRKDRANAIRCGECPKLVMRCWCSIMARTTLPNTPACEFGRKEIHAKRVYAGLHPENRKTKGKRK